MRSTASRDPIDVEMQYGYSVPHMCTPAAASAGGASSPLGLRPQPDSRSTAARATAPSAANVANLD